MSTAKRKWTIFALIAMLVCSVFGVFGISATPAHAEEATWSGGTFTQTQEDGQTVWTAANDGGAALQQLNYSGTVGNSNTFTFQYRPNDFAAGDTANVAFHVVCANGNRLTYQFLNFWNCWRISYNDATQAEGNYPPNTTDGWSEMDVWFTFTCVFIENYAQIYVDGTLMVTLPNTQKAIFNENATCYFTVWGCNSSVKGMTFSNTEVPVNSWAGSYTPATEGEEAVYTNTDMYSLSTFYHAGEIGDYDTFSFDYRPNGNCAGDTANIQFVIVDINGNQLQYQFRNFYKYYVLLYNDYPIADGNYATNTGAWDCTNQWFHFECVFADGSLQIYVDGELKTTYTETGGILLDKNLTCFMTSWGQTPSIKNLTFSKTNVEPEEPEIPDEPEIEYPTDWTGETYTITVENEEFVYTAAQDNGAAVQYLNYVGTVGNNNTFTFQYRPNAGGISDTSNVSFHVQDTSGNRITFQFLNYWNCWRINYNDATQAEGNYSPNTTDGWSETDVWFTFKCVFVNNNVEVWVDGELMHTLKNTQGANFDENATCFFTIWGCDSSIKNMAFSVTEKPETPVEPEPEEPEVSDPNWTSETYTVAKEGEKLVWTGAQNDDLQSLTYAKDDANGYNTMSFSYRPNEYFAGHDTANVTYNVTAGNTTIGVTFMNHWKLLRVIKYVDGVETAWLAEARFIPEDNYQAGWNAYDVWYDVEVTYTNDVIVVTVNGQEVGRALKHGIDFSDVSVFFSAWACAPSITDITLSKKDIQVVIPDWLSNTYTEADGVYTAKEETTGNAQVLTYTKDDANSYNAISFSFKPNAYYGGFDTANVAFNLVSGDTSIAFAFMNHWKLLRVIKNSPAGEAWLVEARYESEDTYEAGWNKYDQWYDVEIIYTKDIILVYLNGAEIGSVVGHGIDLSNVAVGFSSWACAPSITDIAFDNKTLKEDWVGSTFTKAVEGNEFVYTATEQADSAQTLTYVGDTSAYNTVSFAFRPNEYYAVTDAVGLAYFINISGNRYLAVTFMNHWKLARYAIYENGEIATHLADIRYESEETYESGWNKYDQWYNVTISYSNSYISVTINGTTLKNVYYDLQLNYANAFFSTWATAPSIKNMQYSTVEMAARSTWYSNWFTEEDGVYTATQDAYSVQTLSTSTINVANYNTVSFSFKANAYYGGFDTANVAFNLVSGDTSIAFAFMNHWKLLRVIKNSPAGEAWLTEARYESEDTYEAGWNKYDQWYDVEIIYTNDVMIVSVNGVEVGAAVGHGLNVNNAVASFSVWSCAPSITDIAFDNKTLKEDWVGSTFTKAVEGNEFVYTATQQADSAQTLTYVGDTSAYNTVSFAFRPNEYYAVTDAVGLAYFINISGNRYLAVTFMNHWKLARYAIYENGEIATHLADIRYESEETYESGWNKYDQWYNVTISYSNSYISVTINGTTLKNVYYDLQLNYANAFFSTWATAPSIKNMQYSTIEMAARSTWYSNWFTEVDGVYTAMKEPLDAVQVLNYDKTDASSYNKMSFSFKANADYGGFDTANVAFNLVAGDTTFAVTFMNHWKLLRVIKYVNGVETAWLTEARYVSEDGYEAGWNNCDVWYDVEIIYTNDVMVVSVNGVEVGAVVGHGVDFSNIAVKFSSWGCAPSITDIAFSNTEVDVDGYKWAGSTFEKAVEVDGTVYTSTGDLLALQQLNYAYKTGTNNAITYSVRFNEDGLTEPERNISFNVTSSKNAGVVAAYQLLPHWNAARLQIFYPDGSGVIVGVGNYVPTEWLHVTCIFEANYLMMYVNGELIALSFDSLWNDFNDTNCNFSVWGTSASVKGMIFSTEEKDLTELWKGTNYTPSEVDGEIVYTATHTGGVNQLGYAGTTENYNTVTFEVLAGTKGSQNERNAGFSVYNYGTAMNLFFEIMPARGEARIRLLSGNGALFGVRARHADINGKDWITVTCVFEEEYAAMFINGDLVLSYFGIEDCQFSDTLCMMSAWDTAASFRNMTFSTEEYTLAGLGYTDLDFLDEKGFDAVSAENAVVAYDKENQEVDVTVQAENPVVSFVVNQTVGGLYSAYLPIRNTILIRMANGTLAEQLKFYLLTSESDEWYEKTIEILPNSGYSTYYVNVSDLGVDGYLRGMKFEFVGVNSGTVSIDAISFEREGAIYEFAAENFSLLADKETGTVTFSGKLLSKYAGKEIKLIEMDNSNYQELLSYFPQKLIATGTADNNGNFTITFPLKQEGSEMTHLSTIFLASVDGVKLANSFQIENYRDFINNPYAFELPELTVSVMDAQFGAVGDGFTNDNAAIQAAIDYVAAQGGGVVVLPGDTANDYGRRYIATNLEMRSNVELRIEKGAVLWQSPRIADYDYDVIIGHDYETNVMWPHACNVNRPLILLRGVENVRVTGGGTIRMLDWGAEEKDPMKLIDPSHSASCGNIIHIAPIFSVSSTNVEFSDLKILRTNNWNLTTLYTKNLFVANVHFGEVNCKNGDGIGLCNIDGAYIVRCRLFGTDDAFTLNGSHNDPRWFISDWGEPINPVHKGAQNIEIAHCNMRGGLGLVFIPWGTNAEDLSTSETKNVVVYDSIITGFGQDIGGWVDDPFYGWSSNENFLLANGEFDDYAPIKDVYMYNNKYKFDKAIITQLGNSVVADSANFITDSVLKCTSQFVNSSFERNLRYDGEETWVSGLSYWSSIVNENGEVGYEARGEKEATAKYSQVDYTVTDYAGFASNGKLYQGLYLERGIYAMTATVKNVAGTAELFVGKSLLKQHIWDETAVEVLSTQAVPVSDEYAEVTFTFTVKTAGVYAVGLTHSGTVGEKAYLDDVSIEQTGTVEDEEAAFEKAKADTQNYLSLAKSHDKNLYTAESYAALATAMQNAEEALANADTDRATYEACANGLLEAMKALVEIDFAAENKAVLETTVATAKTYTADKYTEQSFAALQTAIANAEAAIANGATAEEYESLNTALTAAIDGLTEKPAQPSEKPDEKPEDKPATGCGAVAFSSSAVALLALGATLTVFARKRKD